MHFGKVPLCIMFTLLHIAHIKTKGSTHIINSFAVAEDLQVDVNVRFGRIVGNTCEPIFRTIFNVI